MASTETLADNKKLEPDQAVVDARMEYPLLVSTYTALAQMYWTGYTAFFALNTLLGTGFWFSYSSSVASSNPAAIAAVHRGFPVAGVAISLIAIFAAVQIRSMQALTNARGRELELLLQARMFSRTAAYVQKQPIATILGSLLFMAFWVFVLIKA